MQPYTTSFSKRKTISISIDKNLKVNVKAPTFVSQRQIDAFVSSKSNWINKKLKYMSEIKQQKALISASNTYSYLGNSYNLEVNESIQDYVAIVDNKLVVNTLQPQNILYTDQLIKKWYWAKCAEIYKESASRYFKAFQEYKVKTPIILVSTLKGKWGQCDSLCVIKINKELIKTPIECIDYVVVHELCHLLVKDHGKKFYELMSKHFPNWKTSRKILKSYALFNLD